MSVKLLLSGKTPKSANHLPPKPVKYGLRGKVFKRKPQHREPCTNTGNVYHLDNCGADEAKAKETAESLTTQFGGAVKYFVVAQKSLDKSVET